MTTLDLDAILAAHLKATRLDETRPALCTGCAQNWPCDAVLLVDELDVDEARFAVLNPGATVLVRFNVGRLMTEARAARLRQLLEARKPDVTWLIVEADEIVGFNPPPTTETAVTATTTEENRTP